MKSADFVMDMSRATAESQSAEGSCVLATR
jgi:hypothetical protein